MLERARDFEFFAVAQDFGEKSHAPPKPVISKLSGFIKNLFTKNFDMGLDTFVLPSYYPVRASDKSSGSRGSETAAFVLCQLDSDDWKFKSLDLYFPPTNVMN